MKNTIRQFLYGAALVMAGGCLSGCTDYLNRSEESVVSEDMFYKNFYNFQGFTEELYNCIPPMNNYYWQSDYNWGEDELSVSGSTWFMGYKVDNGDFWGWQSEHDGWGACWMDGTGDTTSSSRMEKRMWPLMWYGIYKANLGLEHLDDMVDCTTEEHNLIGGQLYFFRGWFHFMLIQYFGGMPYIDYLIDSSASIRLPRLSYHECADKIAEDLRRAADLLPLDWDDTTAGANTLGNNRQRINKIMALGYLGKNYLWAGSPLMNYESTGSKTYNADYCQKAAETFAEMLPLCEEEGGTAKYSLMDFEDYSDIFYTLNQNYKIPGGDEAIFMRPAYEPSMTFWNQSIQYTPGVLLDGSSNMFSPTANYVNYYGMANGLPISDCTQADAESGYDPTHPWKDRDPRFYHDIVFDGVQCIQGATSTREAHRYANLYTGGSYRDDYSGSRTGYLMYKFVPIGTNNDDRAHAQSHHIVLSYMRLADIYLMYAEAVANGYSSPTASVTGFSKTAVDAINHVRDRAGVGHVASKYLGSTEAFMSEVRRERAVELAYEGHRFIDLRRWLLLTEYPYNIKTRINFDRGTDFNTETPKENTVLNLEEEVIIERNFSTKHYWLPLKTADTNIYLEFDQNPGW